MGHHLMKEAPDVDFYVEWSSVVEAWTFAGTRTEMLDHLSRDADPWLRPDAPHHPEQRLGRTDTTGTSSLWVAQTSAESPEFAARGYPEEGAWEHRGHIYMQRGFCPRPNLFVLVRRQIDAPDADIEDLLAPFEDGCRCDHTYQAHTATGCRECACRMRVTAPLTEPDPQETHHG